MGEALLARGERSKRTAADSSLHCFGLAAVKRLLSERQGLREVIGATKTPSGRR